MREFTYMVEKQEPKFSIIPTFASDIEIPILDFVSCKNKFNNQDYIHFIDENGRIGKMKEEQIGILFILEPNKEEMDDFIRLKKESIEFLEKIKSKKTQTEIYS